ncbi:MAG: hypothetical protein IPM29_28680 [Planctomycetes bacterium]|nr:hypothetical protein [Planctomycetota bacterium]
MTIVPAAAGVRVPRLPLDGPERGPLCWWFAVVVGHPSLRVRGVAPVERFVRAMKSACTRRIPVRFEPRAMRDEVGADPTWCDEHRLHQALDGRTPVAVQVGRAAPRNSVALEPRWQSSTSGCTSHHSACAGTCRSSGSPPQRGPATGAAASAAGSFVRQ